MRKFIIIFNLVFFGLFGGICGNSIAQTTLKEASKNITQGSFKKYKVDTLNIIEVKRYLIDLNKDQLNDTLVLENLNDLVGDPQLYTILEIRLSNGGRYVLKNITGKLNDPITKVGFRNRLNSNLLFIPELKNGKCLIFIWDNQYPDCTAQFEIFGFGQNGFKSLLKKDMYVKKISSLNNEKAILLEGKVDCDTKAVTKKLSLE